MRFANPVLQATLDEPCDIAKKTPSDKASGAWNFALPRRSDDELRAAFHALKSFKDLARLLGYPVSEFVQVLYRTPATQKYRSFSIPKRRGGKRLILAPAPKLKLLQKRLSKVLYAVHEPRFAAHGFVRERGIATNASMHVAKAHVCNVDLEDFFNSIHFGRVRGVFLAKPFLLPETVATAIAQVCCHEGALPQGAPTSPVVSNMVATMLDHTMKALAARYECVYTRYADDLTLSTNNSPFPEALMDRGPDGRLRVGKALAPALERQGFRPNVDKLHLSHQRMRQEVTGLVVNRKVNVRREYIRQTRAMIHAIAKFGDALATAEHNARYSKNAAPGTTSLLRVVGGRLEFIRSTLGSDSPVYQNLQGQFEWGVYESSRAFGT